MTVVVGIDGSAGSLAAIRLAAQEARYQAPGRALVEAARAVRAQLVVLSTRGEATVARVLGAVSQHVLRHAPCPVLVVPDGSRSLSNGETGA
jgi:nucleotide-binding universal stress UspA family protein